MRQLHTFPTWSEAEEAVAENHQWNAMVPAAHRDRFLWLPLPVTRAFVGAAWWWVSYHARHWRCVVGPHAWGKWNDHHALGEYTEDGYYLKGPLTGRTRNCTRCEAGQGQGDC